MKRIAALVAALLLLSVPVMAQTESPPAGTVLVVAAVWDGLTWVPVPGAVIAPPLACDPS